MKKRNYNIDVLKAFAIISVILIHGLTHNVLYAILAPYYIWQTVPVFMILMGYNLANSYNRKEKESVSEILNQNHLRKKATRIMLPFTVIWGMQLLIQLVYFKNTNVSRLILSFFAGGYGPGSYFIPMVIQATLLTPLLYVLIRKSPTKMMILLLFVSLAMEYSAHLLGMSGGVYKYLIIRHIFALTLGIWYAFKKTQVTLKWLMPLALVSFIYITAVHYFDWSFIMEEYWHSQHAPSYFWVLLLVIAGLRLYNFKKDTLIERTLIHIGQASFHIYLTQMFYFWLIHDRLPSLHWALDLVLTVGIPVGTGLFFYYGEKYLKSVSVNDKRTTLSA